MKKDTLRLGIITIVVLIAYNFAVFMIPCLKTGTFWVSWGFSLLSFGVAGYAIHAGLIKNSDAKSRFYGFPIARIGFIYLVVQVALGGVFMALGHILPWWSATVLFAILLALAAIGLVSAEAVVAQIQQQDSKLKTSVSLMRGLQSKLGQMCVQCDEPALKALAEEFRYSDPVSSEAIAEAEAALCAAVDALQAAVVEGNAQQIQAVCRQAGAQLAERNRLCKLNKN